MMVVTKKMVLCVLLCFIVCDVVWPLCLLTIKINFDKDHSIMCVKIKKSHLNERLSQTTLIEVVSSHYPYP
jgi:hypothetical protein